MGGTSSIEDMIKSTGRVVLVTRLWYLREVDPRTILYTGLTRDGTFLIENGKVTKAVRNFRFNDSPLYMLNNLEMLGPSVRLAGTEQGGDIVMPTIKVKDFNFTTLSGAGSGYCRFLSTSYRPPAPPGVRRGSFSPDHGE